MVARSRDRMQLVTSPSSSPENAFYLPNGNTAHACMGPTIDNQIVRELYTHLIAASKTLNIDAALRDTLEYPVNPNNFPRGKDRARWKDHGVAGEL